MLLLYAIWSKKKLFNLLSFFISFKNLEKYLDWVKIVFSAFFLLKNLSQLLVVINMNNHKWMTFRANSVFYMAYRLLLYLIWQIWISCNHCGNLDRRFRGFVRVDWLWDRKLLLVDPSERLHLRLRRSSGRCPFPQRRLPVNRHVPGRFFGEEI